MKIRCVHSRRPAPPHSAAPLTLLFRSNFFAPPTRKSRAFPINEPLDVEPRGLIDTLLKEIGERFPENLSEDDVTLLVVRANGNEAHFSFREKLGALARFIGSLFRALNPRAERPPFPDANLANIGGAIVPALGRRWRATSTMP